MKTLYKSFFALVAATALLISCSDDDGANTDGGNVPSTGTYINAKIDGDTFETMSYQGITTGAATKSGTGESTFIMVTASAQNTNTMVIGLMGITGTGTYPLNADTETFVAFTDMNSNIAYHSSADCTGVDGEIKITHFSDEKIEGTFSYKGADDDCTGTKNVTNGKFRGVYMQR